MRIAVFQRVQIYDDARAVVARMADDLASVALRGVDLAVFPECHLLGHSYDPATIERRAIDIDEERWRSVFAMLAPVAATVVLGSFERRPKGITNSALVIERGRVVGRYAKRHPNEPCVVAGCTSPVFACAGTHYGINICADANHPDAAASLADTGATVICYPLNNMLPRETAARWHGGDRAASRTCAHGRGRQAAGSSRPTSPEHRAHH